MNRIYRLASRVGVYIQNQRCNAICLLMLSLALFVLSVALRFRYFGDIASGNSEASTGDILRWTRMWFEEGPWNVLFGMPDLFSSIEFPDLSARGIYLSYPPGVVAFPYFLSRLGGIYPSPGILMGANLLGHFFAGVCVARLLQLCLLRNGCKPLFIFASMMVALVVVYFSRGPFYFMQNVYVHDTAVILWLSLAVLVELQIFLGVDPSRKSRVIQLTLLFVFLFLALFTDWSAYFILSLTFLINLYCYYRSRKAQHMAMAVVKSAAVFFALICFAVIMLLHDYENLWGRFMSRFGGGAGVDQVSFNPRLLVDIGLTTFNRPTVFFVLPFLLIYGLYLFGRLGPDRAKVTSSEERVLYLIPLCFFFGGVFYNLFFFSHTYFLIWSGIKFTVPVAFLVGISPWVIFVFLQKTFGQRWSKQLLFISSVPAVLLASYTALQCFKAGGLFPPRDDFPVAYRDLDSVREKIEFSDVIFSYDFSIGQKTLQSAFLSRPVYLVQDSGQIVEKLTAVGNGANAVLFQRADVSRPEPTGKPLVVSEHLGTYGDYNVIRLSLRSP